MTVSEQIADELYGLHCDIGRLEIENRKLREQNSKLRSGDGGRITDEYVAYMGWGFSAQEQIDGLRKEIRELKAENAELRTMRDTWQENDAKLRELVRDMYEMAYPEYPSAFAAAFADRMAQLGMEVDE